MSTTSVPALKLRERLAYACGDYAANLIYGSLSWFLLIFYTDVFGLAPVTVGLILGISRACDAFVDPLAGILADRTQTRWGKFRPYLLWVCGPFALMGTLLFTTPHLGTVGKIIWACITYNGTMICFSLIAIPYSALLGVISPNPVERTKTSAWKFAFAYGGVLTVHGGLLFLVRTFGGGNAARGYQYALGTFGLIAILFYLIAFAGTRERVSVPVGQRTPIRRDLADLFRNVPWLILFAGTLAWILFVGLRGSITAHYIKYYVGTQSIRWWWNSKPTTYGFTEIMSAFTSIGTIGALVGSLFTGWFASKVGRKAAFLSMLGAAAICTGSFAWLRPDQVGAMFVLQVLGSVTGGPLCVLLWAMYADAADYSEWKRGRRATALVFAASSMANKFGWAFCHVLSGVFLQAAGYVANVPQSPRVLHGIVMLVSWAPAACGCLSLLMICFYPLNDKRLAVISSDLQARRLKAASDSAAS